MNLVDCGECATQGCAEGKCRNAHLWKAPSPLQVPEKLPIAVLTDVMGVMAHQRAGGTARAAAAWREIRRYLLAHQLVIERPLSAGDGIELEHLRQVVNHPLNDQFLKGVSIEAEHQRRRWGEAADRSKSAENWFWLVGYLAGKALRAAIAGDRDKALHHTISSAAALANWHEAILRDESGAGMGQDLDMLQPGQEVQP